MSRPVSVYMWVWRWIRRGKPLLSRGTEVRSHVHIQAKHAVVDCDLGGTGGGCVFMADGVLH